VAEQQQDVDALKRRGRRRLVGAVALVLAAVIVLPMVFDSEPRSPAPPVSVRIPGEGDTPFAPKMPAKPPARAPAKVEAPKAEAPKPVAVRPPEKETPKIKPAPKAPSPSERARAEAALAGGGPQFYVPVGAFANPESAIAKLSGAKIPYYTEDLAVSG
jgi:DedD protein